MSLKTKLLELFKYEPDKDGAQTFNIRSALNDNWDKIDAWAQSVKTALAGLVPTSRKVNGKTLSADVTLTAADIKMPNSKEDVGTAMAKRPLEKETLTSAGDINAKSAFPYGKSLVFRTTDSDWGGNMPSAYAAYAKLRSSLSGSYDMWFGASDCRFWFARAGDDAIPERNIWYELARCVAPEVHDLPLYSDYTNRGCKYFRTQEGIVSFAGEIYSPSGFIADAYFATLPEGFRPDHAIIVPALLYPSRSPVSLIIETNGAVRITVTSSDTYLYMQATFVAG